MQIHAWQTIVNAFHGRSVRGNDEKKLGRLVRGRVAISIQVVLLNVQSYSNPYSLPTTKKVKFFLNHITQLL